MSCHPDCQGSCANCCFAVHGCPCGGKRNNEFCHDFVPRAQPSPRPTVARAEFAAGADDAKAVA